MSAVRAAIKTHESRLERTSRGHILDKEHSSSRRHSDRATCMAVYMSESCRVREGFGKEILFPTRPVVVCRVTPKGGQAVEADNATSAWAALYSSAGGLRAGGGMSGARAFGIAHPTVSVWECSPLDNLNGELLPHVDKVRARTAGPVQGVEIAMLHCRWLRR